ncbi:MAG TPA: phosphotransferase [Candidatus Moranbacteria bacterium]|nr:phosphotransferase [Candidatus Moranbacteria bacterium]HSA08422.1 phosphotransferase [Candidatus Moranbacteria bacterium]
MKKLQQHIEKFYNFTNVKISHIRSSEDNDTYKVSSNCGLFFVRLSKRLVKDTNEVMKELDFLQFLKKQNVLVAGVIKNINGLLMTNFENKILVVFEWIEGNSFNILPNNYLSELQAYNGGSALASVHNASIKYGTPFQLQRTITTEIERALLLSDDIKARYNNGNVFLDIITKMIDFAKNNISRKNIIIHNDFRPHNVLFGVDSSKKKISCIVDFDWICVAPPIKDLALALVEWSLADGGTEVNWRNFNAFFKGYCNIIDSDFYPKVSDLEQWIEFSCLSDTATYIADVITEEKKRELSVNFEPRELKSHMFRKIQYFKQIDIESNLK